MITILRVKIEINNYEYQGVIALTAQINMKD